MTRDVLFSSSRLSFRPWRSEDEPILASILTHPQTMVHWPAPMTTQAVQDWLQRAIDQAARYGVSRFCCQLHDGTVIGDVGALVMPVLGRDVVDLGYIIHADYWRCGYGLEAALAVVDWIVNAGNEQCVVQFPEHIESIVATMASDNIGSAAVARRLGMTLTETYTNPKNLNKETYLFETRLADLTGER